MSWFGPRGKTSRKIKNQGGAAVQSASGLLYRYCVTQIIIWELNSFASAHKKTRVVTISIGSRTNGSDLSDLHTEVRFRSVGCGGIQA